MGVLSIDLDVALRLNPAQNVLGDSITALGFAICFYYGFTGFACAVYYRKELFKSCEGSSSPGFCRSPGCAMMSYVFGKALHDYSQPDAGTRRRSSGSRCRSSSASAPAARRVAMLFAVVRFREFFRRRPEVAPEGIL